MAARLQSKIPTLAAPTVRRLLLAAQGLLNDPTRRATTASVGKLIHQMGFVQIDTINVVHRAHHLILASRLDGYQPVMLARLLEQKRVLFEHWTHDASAIPSAWFPHWRRRFERYRHRLRTSAWWMERIGENPDRLLDAVRQRIIDDGPLLSKDFEHDRSKANGRDDSSGGGWWGWKPQKAALEHLWRIGELAVARRINFQKVYDLTERVLPDHITLPPPDEDEHIEWACRSALERLGAGTPGEIAAFWNAVTPAQSRRWCETALQRGEIMPVIIEPADGSKPRLSLALPEWPEKLQRLRQPDDDGRIRLLCPFDPVLRDRKRTQRLFNFDYTFEAFVPAPKRRYGYYVMPLLEGDRFIGRIDPKFHRERSMLEIRGLWWEPGVKSTRKRRAALNGALHRLAAFVGAREVRWPPGP